MKMKKLHFVFALLLLISCQSKTYTRLTFNLEKIDQKVSRQLKVKSMKNKRPSVMHNKLEWMINSGRISLNINDFETQENANEKILQMRMLLSNASRQGLSDLGDESYFFGSHQDKGGTLIFRKQNLIFKLTTDDLDLAHEVSEIISKTLRGIKKI